MPRPFRFGLQCFNLPPVHEAADAAGRNFAEFQLSTLTFVVAIGDDPKPMREAIALTM